MTRSLDSIMGRGDLTDGPPPLKACPSPPHECRSIRTAERRRARSVMNRPILVAALLLGLGASAKPPRLALFIVVDSLGSEAFLQARGRMPRGVGPLLSQGAYFPVARYGFAEAVTGPGHATLSTGANPRRHGV